MDDYPTSNARNIERIYMMRDGENLYTDWKNCPRDDSNYHGDKYLVK